MRVTLNELSDWLSNNCIHKDNPNLSNEESKELFKKKLVERFGPDNHVCRCCFHCHHNRFCDIEGSLEGKDIDVYNCSSWLGMTNLK